jgi:hypothetical protein
MTSVAKLVFVSGKNMIHTIYDNTKYYNRYRIGCFRRPEGKKLNIE